MNDPRFATSTPPPKRAFVGPLRKDGKRRVTFVFPIAGTRVVNLVPAADVAARTEGYIVQRYEK